MRLPFLQIAIPSLGGFQFGFNTAVISGAVLFLARAFSLSPAQEGAAVSAILLGALAGSSASGPLADRFGRRGALILAAVFFLLGAFSAALAANLALFHAGRIVSGLGVGLVSVISPMYLSEIAPPARRGFYVSCNQFAVTLGILAAYGCNYFFAASENWRMMFLTAVIPALFFLVGLFFIPESPSLAGSSPKSLASWKEIFRPSFRKILLIGFFLMIFQQVTGINSVIYFSSRIFQDAGFSSAEGAILASAGIGLVNVLATAFVLWQIDRLGRKPLLLYSNAVMAISLLVMGWSLTTRSSLVDIIAVISLMAYIAAFAVGMGPIPALMISEICPLKIRGRMLGLATFSNWVFNYVVVFTFLDIGRAFTFAGAFFLYAVCAIAAFFLTLRYIPETRGIVLEENR